MTKPNLLNGFSKLSKEEKLTTLANLMEDPQNFINEMNSYNFRDPSLQKKFEQFSENTISNYHLPFSIAPNFKIDGNTYHVPMVTEESSVVAAASKAAKFWYERGGFRTESISTIKYGHVHFYWYGTKEELDNLFNNLKKDLLQRLKPLTERMEKRGGGIQEVWLYDKTYELENYFQMGLSFDTADSMGANFINSVLEKASNELEKDAEKKYPGKLEVIMAILSNYAPASRITMKVECPVEELNDASPMLNGAEFAEKFQKATEIARHSVSRAVTNNKGIMNGVDSVVIATGNDFRAIEAGVHAFAIDKGTYSSLTSSEVNDGIFTFRITIPLSLGTVGGLTTLHPLASKSLEILGRPNVKRLMSIVAAAGLASNFAAIQSLITSGIQQGHMKLHLENVLMMLDPSEEVKNKAKEAFKDKDVSYSEVKAFIDKIS
jgi:hydroxymethylglutaryl-CoA reductase